MDRISLILFVAVILLAFIRKNNVGVLALGAGAIGVRLFGLTDKILIGGVNTSLFVTLLGITLLFAIVTQCGALKLLSLKIIALAGDRMYLLPILIYLTGFCISVIGPGGVPALAIIPPLAVAVSMQSGHNPLMMALIGTCGMSTGRFSPITPEGLVIADAVASTGMTGNPVPAIMACAFVVNLALAVLLYIAFKGYKVTKPLHTVEASTVEKFNGKQLLSLGGIVLMLILIIFVKVNIGIAAVSVAALLLLLHVSDDVTCIKSMPWGTIILVLGVGAMLNIVNKAGGLDLMNKALVSIMSERTAVPVMGLSAGLMSLVSSALGVVYPTMMPMCVNIAKEVGNVNPAALMSAVAAAGALSGLSPISTGGALVMAAIAGSGMPFTKEDENRIFVQLIIFSCVTMILLVVLSVLCFGVISNMFYHVV